MREQVGTYVNLELGRGYIYLYLAIRRYELNYCDLDEKSISTDAESTKAPSRLPTGCPLPDNSLLPVTPGSPPVPHGVEDGIRYRNVSA